MWLYSDRVQDLVYASSLPANCQNQSDFSIKHGVNKLTVAVCNRVSDSVVTVGRNGGVVSSCADRLVRDLHRDISLIPTSVQLQLS